ncbi:MAG: DUF547 domain-containing protein [Flavobacterium sp.]|nr:DUF547 domain-containing protein [Flavobacterium sp.]
MYKKLIFITLLICSKSFSQNFDYKEYGLFLKKYVSESGNVSYDKIKKKEIDDIAENFLYKTPTNSWSKDDKLAFYINLYNVFTLKSVVDNYPIKSIKDIVGVWDKDFIALGKTIYSLGDIENKILRKMSEPRIHFAVNCASFSCPKLNNEPYTSEKLDKQLDLAAREFINDKTKNIISENDLKISSIFNWFGDDFKKQGSLIEFLNKYSKIKINKKSPVKFLDYNWSLNK